METIERHFAPIAETTAQWHDAIARMAASKVPSFFHLRAQLPRRGRTNTVLGATKHLSVVLKTYASGGENELHAHTNEEHLFLIMQGAATFVGPKGERRDVAKNDCILLPVGSYYCFTAKEGEPLVLLRVGAPVDPDGDVSARIDIEGEPVDGHSERNKEVPYVLDEERVFE